VVGVRVSERPASLVWSARRRCRCRYVAAECAQQGSDAGHCGPGSRSRAARRLVRPVSPDDRPAAARPWPPWRPVAGQLRRRPSQGVGPISGPSDRVPGRDLGQPGRLQCPERRCRGLGRDREGSRGPHIAGGLVRFRAGRDGGGPCRGVLVEHAGQELTAISSASAGQPAMTRLTMPGPAVATFAARSTDSGNACACHPACPWSWASCRMWL
jgi:hypothetical protein